jgi:transposase
MARNTLRLECQLLRLCKVLPQKEAAAQLGLAPSTVARMLHSSIERLREVHKIRGLKNIGIDEISYKKNHCYLTIVYDLDRNCVVWAGKGKARETIDRFFTDVLSEGQRKRIQFACCDMSKTYIGAIEHHLPNATLVLDRFHIIKALNEAVDEVRKQRWRIADADTRAELKGLRFILLKNKKNRSQAERKFLADLERADRRIFRACTLKDELSHFWTYKHASNAEKFLKKWCMRALLSRIEPVRRFVKTLRDHWDGVFASVSGITNAAAEGINRVLKMAKNRASGFRSPENYINIIYLVAGDLDIPAQIPRKNQPRQTKVISLQNIAF